MLNVTRRALTTITRAVRSVVAPAALMVEQAQAAPAVAPDPADMYGDDDMPAVEDIEAAAAGYAAAADLARAGDRGKRKARKLLDRLPAGTYGRWTVARKASNRQVVDIEAVRRIFEAHGLGEVPMRSCAASLVVTRAAVEADVEPPVLAAA